MVALPKWKFLMNEFPFYFRHFYFRHLVFLLQAFSISLPFLSQSMWCVIFYLIFCWNFGIQNAVLRPPSLVWCWVSMAGAPAAPGALAVWLGCHLPWPLFPIAHTWATLTLSPLSRPRLEEASVLSPSCARYLSSVPLTPCTSRCGGSIPEFQPMFTNV